MSVKLEISGIREANRFFDKKKKNIFKKENIGLKNAALFLQGEVKSSIAGQRAEPTSVDTGQLLRSVDTRVGTDDAVVFSNVKHSKFIEFGTSKFIGRKHFRNSKNRNKEKIRQLLEKEIKKI